MHRPVPQHGHDLSFPGLAIIDTRDFAAAQSRLAMRFNHGRANGRAYLLTGFLRCTCGKAMCGHTSNNSSYYVCSTQRGARHLIVCKARSLRQGRADAAIWGWLRNLLTDPDAMRAAIANVSDRNGDGVARIRRAVERCERDMASTDAKIARVMAAFGAATDATLADAPQAELARLSAARAAIAVDLVTQARGLSTQKPTQGAGSLLRRLPQNCARQWTTRTLRSSATFCAGLDCWRE
jgi:Recombinase zinc beta ribbon domain